MRRFRGLPGAIAIALAIPLISAAGIAAPASADTSGPTLVNQAVRFDVTPPLIDMPMVAPTGDAGDGEDEDDADAPVDTGYTGDAALDPGPVGAAMPGPAFSFEGLRNADNPIQVSPPDTNGDIGLHHYVEMVNLTFAVYARTGERLYGPATLGTLWQGFLPDCQALSGDPVVLYDRLANRWLLSQFTTRGPEYYNCVAVSTSQDPLGSYYRYAFSTGPNFPDYPKYGVWPDAYYITTREFAPNDDFYGVGVYAVDRRQMIEGVPNPRMVKFNLAPQPAYLPGDGLLPADHDGRLMPPAGSPEYFVGAMDDGAGTGAPFDGLNVFAMKVNWAKPNLSTFGLTKQIPIAAYDTIFPCAPGSRNCIPQPGTTNKIDILSSRQRPTWRLQYRNFGDHEALVTNQSVEARPGMAGVRWWELRNPADAVLYQEGTWAPDDGVHRWMGSAATDAAGNLAVGYSVSNATSVYPGIRYAGRLVSDPLGTLGQGEAVLMNGSGAQLVSARWGDYSSLNVDPTDNCTFWYATEYYQTSSARGWQTRIGTFRFPNCG